MAKYLIFVLALGVASSTCVANADVAKPRRPAQSINCPPGNSPARVVAQIKGAPNCAVASAVANQCGAFADLTGANIAVTAIGVCETGLRARMNADDAKMYASLKQKCVQKYKDTTASVYRSAEAFCQLSVSSLFSDLTSPVDQ